MVDMDILDEKEGEEQRAKEEEVTAVFQNRRALTSIDKMR